MNSLNESAGSHLDSEKEYSNLCSLLDRNFAATNTCVQQNIKSFIESLCNSENIEKSDLLFKVVERFNTLGDTIVSDRIIKEYTVRILPYIQNISAERNNASSYSLTESQVEVLEDSYKVYEIADRILNNHSKLSSRFNIENEATKYPSRGLKAFINSCAVMIDTYNIKEYQKLNLTIEESTYLLEKNGYDYNKSELLKYALEYYLIKNPYTSNSDIRYFREAIEENYLFTEENFDQIQYLFNKDLDNNNVSIEKSIDNFLISSNKTPEGLAKLISNTLAATSKQDILYNVDKFVYLLWDLTKAGTFENDEAIYDCLRLISDHIADSTKLVTSLDSTEEDYSKDEVEAIINKLNDAYHTIADASNNIEWAYSARQFNKMGLEPCITGLEYVAKLLYKTSNIEAMKLVNSNEAGSMPLNEFKIFKFHNLINAAFGLDRFLKVKEKRFIEKNKPKFKKFASNAKHVLFGESAREDMKNNIYAYIGEDCKADICLAQYILTTEDAEDEVAEFLTNVCNEYNDLLLSQNTENMKCYYTITPGLAELHIKEATIIELTDEEKKAVSEAIDPAEYTYFELFAEGEELYNEYKDLECSSIEETLFNMSNYEGFDKEHFDLALEALKFLNVDKSTVSIFGEKFSEYRFNEAIDNGVINESYLKLATEETKVKNDVEEWVAYPDVPQDIQLEAYKYLTAIFEDIKKPLVGGKALEDRMKKQGYLADDWEDDDDDEQDDVDTTTPEKKPEEKKKEDTSKSGNNQNNKASESDNTGRPQPRGSKINLNSIKLALNGLRTKYKDMSTKAKEISRNLDISIRTFVKGIKDAEENDRREQIIKGSILPSFGKCCKLGLVLAGLGIATGGVVVPIITALGAFALNKKLTDKERYLILDEIETELEVVEKELAIADSENNIKKYRALLQYKKDLQRQYQRIRYNIRVGKDTGFSSNVGAPTKDM